MEVVIGQPQSVHPAKESGDVGEVRRAAVARAEALGFDETARGKVALVVTEAGTNLIKHAGGGQIILGTVTTQSGTGLEILAIDRGPGIPDVVRGMRDGYSTAGSPGNGLGGMRRMSSFFELYSSTAGTVLVSRILPPQPRKPAVMRWHLGAICLPLHGESVCGDGWGYSRNGERALVVIVDGLGHGQAAYQAAQDTLKVFRDHPQETAPELLRLANLAARGGRGAAAAIADVNLERGVVTYAGLGNTSASLLTVQGASRSMVSQHGVLGASERRIQPFEYPWTGEGVFILHSDGLTSRWDLSGHAGLLQRDPSLIAAVLFRDFSRPRDDVSVVVCKVVDAA